MVSTVKAAVMVWKKGVHIVLHSVEAVTMGCLNEHNEVRRKSRLPSIGS